MYIELLVTMLAVQKVLLDCYQAADYDKGIGLFALAHKIASMDFFGRTKPPLGCEQIHKLCIESQRLCIQTLVFRHESKPIPDELLREYERVNEEFAVELSKLRDSNDNLST